MRCQRNGTIIEGVLDFNWAGLTNQAQELEVNNKNVKEFYKPGSS